MKIKQTNEEKKVGIVVLARMDSARLPDKALATIYTKRGQKTALEIILDSLTRQKQHEVVLATTDRDCDDGIVKTAEMFSRVHVHRGENDSPLHRMLACAEKFGFDHVVRVTVDHVTVDTEMMLDHVRHHLKFSCDYTFNKRMPSGMSVDIYSRAALLAAVRAANGRPVEFCAYYIKDDASLRIKEFTPPRAYQYSHFRLLLDFPEDLLLLRMLYARLAYPVTGLDIIHEIRGCLEYQTINQLPEFSFYICAYNAKKYIRETLASIAAQTNQNFELIIVDDCSTDGTLCEVAEWLSGQSFDFRKKVIIHRNEENLGLASSCNRAMKYARGKYVIRVDADDVIVSNFLDSMSAAVSEYPDSDIWFSHYQETDAGLSPIGDPEENEEHHQGCAMIRAAAAHTIKYAENVRHYEGKEFMKRFLERFEFAIYPEVLWYYRKHPESLSASNPEERAAALEKLGG